MPENLNLSNATTADLAGVGLKKIQTVIPLDLYHDLRVRCAVDDTTQRDFIVHALERAIHGKGER